MSNSPQSPPKEAEQGVQSPDEEAQMNDLQDPQAAGLAYEFEVKEQDRWLPIANGAFVSLACATPQRIVLFYSLMSHGSPPKSPEAARPLTKPDRYDQYDANIRNFAPVARIMKNALPENAKIAKEAKECMQECVSEFISFITSEASEKCHQEKRKTVNGEDILFAMTSLGFENYSEALKIYLSKYREQSQSNRNENPTGRPDSQGGYGGQGGAPGPSNTGSASFQAGELTGQGEGAEANYMYAQPGNGTGPGEGY
ncbi:histone-fold-containing protein [Coniella lustricola]|uniref:Histone-fold-containing protein n=1 Tax=Coniella lustricola TaxID=2025994 RepID=A0A2T3AIV1_9PEZI|nr:histone-fold-containing protein [Coniella lustricola]